MAELATIARPYAEALFKAIGPADADAVAEQVGELAQIAARPELRQFSDDPRVDRSQVFDVIVSVAKGFVGDGAKNLLRTVIDNGRLAALPEIASQYRALVNERSGVYDAIIYSAFPIDDGQRADVVATLEQRFRKKLRATVEIDPKLIGGIRVVVGDEVLDTSVAARLQQMRVALTA